ncbi:hypothetical protein AAGG49_22635, partial [Stenotrophomonas maltophilia]|uniref:hypothetical protein n=1 Tax=Stenotrophomonas maltophilia TaxID=40324 RepID=UPI00313BB07E
ATFGVPQRGGNRVPPCRFLSKLLIPPLIGFFFVFVGTNFALGIAMKGDFSGGVFEMGNLYGRRAGLWLMLGLV